MIMATILKTYILVEDKYRVTLTGLDSSEGVKVFGNMKIWGAGAKNTLNATRHCEAER